MKLFERASIGSVKMRNRIIMAPMGRKTAPDGGFDDRTIAYYEARAKGGVGAIITGLNIVTTEFETRPCFVLETYHQCDRLGLAADKVQAYGGKFFVQIGPGLGRVAYANPDRAPYSASAIPTRNFPNLNCRPLSVEQIQKIVSYMARGALMAKKAGADGIEIHAYGGYLIDQFLTKAWNKRTDEYGGDLEGRMRFLKECIEAIRKACGPRFPIIVKITVNHYIDNPEYRHIEEGVELAKQLEALGVDAIHVDTGCYEKYYMQVPTVYQAPGFELDDLEIIKKAVSIPVIGQGKLNDEKVAEEGLQKNQLDFVAIGHQLLADPDWCNKIKDGRKDEVVCCVGCNECLYSSLQGRFSDCAVNPMCGHEIDYPFVPSKDAKKLLVVGGGPAGMETALAAEARGHQVELWEMSDKLGGNLIAAGAPTFKKDVNDYLEYLKRSLAKSDVTVQMNKKGTTEEIVQGGYDYVALATGSRAFIPPIPGVESKNVLTAFDAFTGKPLTGRVAVIGAGLVGCEAAVHASATADSVVLIDIMPDILQTVEHLYNNDQCLRQMVKDSNAQLYMNATVKKISENGLELTQNGETLSIECDTIVIASGYRSNAELEDQLYGKVPDVRLLGDAVAPRKIVNAVSEGFHYARIMN
ncbi:NAD(P)/FAD-dependent oxidoreductase [Oscillospiraceae bacterium MB08-C2-2]|nr:NAD(P)/FAD-dependent oxidoreductase [Oscillospiraceae bacterium MB08-C2-2]